MHSGLDRSDCLVNEDFYQPRMPSVLLARSRILYAVQTISVLLLGVASRRFLGQYAFIKLYVGDGLWALMVFLGFAFVFRHRSTVTLAALAFGFSVGIELSQLYHAPWIDRLRATTFGGLILGYSFVWSDLLCYGLGVGIGALLDAYLIRSKSARLKATGR